MAPSRAILLVGKLTHALKDWEALSSLAELKEYPTGSPSDFLTTLHSPAYSTLLAIARSNDSTSLTGPFDAALIAALPASVRYITHNGAGYDNIDVAACTARGIQVSSTPIAVDGATADTAIFLMLGALRRVERAMGSLRRGEWRGKGYGLGHDPKDKVLGILGMGGIGRAVAQRARAFGMSVQYHNRNRLPEDKEVGARYVSFDELMRSSDVLSLNLALNASTRHIISTPQFALMKPGVVVVNTARGPIIDEAALVAALESGKVFSAGLDVFEDEPRIHPGLLANPDVVLLPHLGTATWETQRAMEVLVLENLREVLEGRGLVTRVPEQREMEGGSRAML
ncbi:hypothetical protein LTS16_024272 [Friedmanniomyces endolithicus]|nr:hypothetical protein LTS02_001508 [Friedmanniomyces endolithicus]KAK0880045.1 hypothetical protein LTR87_006099 [Friedmanniomyces endolithicus]KAK0997778.1 hypothetical protein LTS01_005951 [Friedmanniomyces endolithicus]KAK1024194.1 hypothetical protein LTS16_024272 [Friedmanniomyces endolithicus]